MTRKRVLEERLSALAGDIDRISRSMDRIEVATIVREPSSQLSVDAYDGLRRQVVAAAGDRMTHLYQLARFSQAVATGASAQDLAPLVAEWVLQAGLEQVDDLSDSRYYDVLGGVGPDLVQLRPAYRDAITGRAVVMGQVERVETTVEMGHEEAVR
jgi:hypothetical protein